MCSEISCPLCNISTFPDIDSFKLNLIKVNSKPIKCPLCSEILLGLDKLTIHLFGHSLPYDIKSLPQDETPPKPHKKAVKPKQSRIKLVKMTSPPKAPTDDNHRCEICGFVFVDEQLLNLHLSLVHNFTPNSDNSQQSHANNQTEMKNTQWKCHLCGKNFKMKGALRIHIRVAHVRFHDQNQRQINIADYLKSQKSIDMCTVKTELLSLQDPYSPDNNSQQSLTQYNAVSSPAGSYSSHGGGAKSPSSQQEQKVSSFGIEGGTKNLKTFQCEECKKTFTTKYFLKKHKRLHTGEMPYTCEIEGCGKMFHFQQSYHKHLLYHSDAKPYECTDCGRAFKELSTLHNHQRIHSGIKPFGCHCGKFFRQKVSFLVHQRIHNGSLPYKCSECGKGFRYKVSQRSHKCSGVLERQPGDLIQKLMRNSSILPASTSTVVSNNNNNNVSLETTLPTPTATNDIVNINISNQKQHELSHELCLDDLLKESYEKLMKVNDNDTQLLPQIVADNAFETNTNIMSFGSSNNNNTMAINSNYGSNNNFPTLETINEDSIKELLYGHVG